MCFFQAPPIYSGGEEVYSNCLGSGTLPSYHMTGSTHIFQVERRYYAGVEMTAGPAIGNASGFGLAFRPIEPTPHEGSSGAANNWTLATPEPLSVVRNSRR